MGAYSSTQKDKKGKPVFTPAWNWRCTTKPGKVFIHIFNWPADGKLVVPMTDAATSAFLLADPGTKLETASSDAGLTVTLPAKAPDAIASVVEIDIDGAPHPTAGALAAPVPH